MGRARRREKEERKREEGKRRNGGVPCIPEFRNIFDTVHWMNKVQI
jgi:hypothetical protein